MYTESQREIFGPYFDGARLRFGDPLYIHHALTAALDGRPNDYLAQARDEKAPVVQRHMARARLLNAAGAALAMVPFDPETGKGALEADTLRALNLFLEFISEVKKKGPSSLTSASPAGDGPSPTLQPTTRPSDFYYAPSGPHGDEPGPSSEELTLPSLVLPFPPSSSTR